VLNVPDDADKEGINAKLNKGVLRITMPRNKAIETESRKIVIESSKED
jgi:HSP20 family protein